MKNKQKHIFIIGMMCSGKSRVASLLSKKLNIPFIDTDRDLTSILGFSIEEIFNAFSEEKFRLLESTYFLEHINTKQHIYATGGGLILDQKNREALCNNENTIFLKTSIDTIYNRLMQNKEQVRPLFIKSPNKKNLQNIWGEREKYYQQCANVIIDTENKSLDAIADEIIKSLNL